MVAVSCSDTEVSERYGSALLSPSVAVDASVTLPDGTVSRDIVGQIPQASQMAMYISSADGRYSRTWEPYTLYPSSEPLRPGEYCVEFFHGAPEAEGAGCTYFYSVNNVMLGSGADIALDAVATLQRSLWDVEYKEALASYFSKLSVILHTQGGNYVECPQAESALVYMRPGKTILAISLEMKTGQTAMFDVAEFDAAAAHLYEVAVDVSGNTGVPVLEVKISGSGAPAVVTVELSERFLSSAKPVLTPIGFIAGDKIAVTEGDIPDSPVSVSVSGEPLRSLILSTYAPSLVERGWPAEIDLQNATDGQLSTMVSLGMVIARNASGNIVSVDFTQALAGLRYNENVDISRFTLLAKSTDGKLSSPLSLEVEVLPSELTVVSVSDILAGANVGEITLLSSTNDLSRNLSVEVMGDDREWHNAPLLDVVAGADGEYHVTFDAGDFCSGEQVEIRVLYCGEEKASRTLRRVSPRYTIEADAYAHRAVVRIIPDDEELLGVITAGARFYIDGKAALAMSRDVPRGMVVVDGLDASHRYRLSCAMVDSEEAVRTAPSVDIVTEGTASIPNGDFEKKGRTLRYKDMPSGGRYSQTIVDIFNQQNYVTFDYVEPKTWANTNAKTFCLQSSHINTWYQHPSAVIVEDCHDGAYAVRLQSTAWDVNGPSIPDYRQEDMPYVKYNRNVPRIAHRAAAKLFLGSYSFNPATGEEHYDEGMPIASRPAALNGYYRFEPCVVQTGERALVAVEVLGEVNGAEIVIARATRRLTPAATYTAFSLPLVYEDFGVKATKIKVMLSSSEHVGSIADETASVALYTDVPRAMATGSTLWVDDISLSY